VSQHFYTPEAFWKYFPKDGITLAHACAPVINDCHFSIELRVDVLQYINVLYSGIIAMILVLVCIRLRTRGAGFMKLSSVRLSVRPSHQSAAARRCGGFAAVGPATGDIN